MSPRTLLALPLCAAAAALFGCRGQVSREPPLWIKHGMEFQDRHNPYEGNAFHADGRNMRTPPAGTVARGLLKEDDAFWRGGDSVQFVKNPIALTPALLERGRERYDIYCSPCHSRTGAGNGMAVQRGFLPPPSLHEDRIVEQADGQIFRTISGGIRNMPAYGKQIPEADRWAIVAYLRALQRSQRATAADVPEHVKPELRAP